MCFSATASFTVGAGLLAAGAYCLGQAIMKRPAYWGLAMVPLFFGVQQISEGVVWLGIERHDDALARNASLVFLLFALAIWPFWFSFLSAVMERQRGRKIVLIGLSVLATGWFFALYLPLLRDPDGLLTTIQMHHSIRYDYPSHPLYNWIRPAALRVVYIAAVGLPFVVGTEKIGRGPGIALGASALVAVLVFDYAFVSVWCFFAAVLALYACVIFYRLERSRPAPEVSSSVS